MIDIKLLKELLYHNGVMCDSEQFLIEDLVDFFYDDFIHLLGELKPKVGCLLNGCSVNSRDKIQKIINKLNKKNARFTKRNT